MFRLLKAQAYLNLALLSHTHKCPFNSASSLIKSFCKAYHDCKDKFENFFFVTRFAGIAMSHSLLGLEGKASYQLTSLYDADLQTSFILISCQSFKKLCILIAIQNRLLFRQAFTIKRYVIVSIFEVLWVATFEKCVVNFILLERITVLSK